MKYKIADLILEYEPKYNLLKSHSEKYVITDCEKEADLKINITDEMINELKKKCSEEEIIENRNKNRRVEEGIEYVYASKKLFGKLIDCNGCYLHSSAIVIDDEAYLISAESGVGKTTHTNLWLKYFADKKPYILNADKPAIRIIDDEIYVYGTPFSGEYNINENKKVKLKAISFLEQSKTNYIKRLEQMEAIELFFSLTTHMLDEDEILKLFNTLEFITKKTPIYKLGCNISEEAAKLSYETMKEGK